MTIVYCPERIPELKDYIVAWLANDIDPDEWVYHVPPEHISRLVEAGGVVEKTVDK